MGFKTYLVKRTIYSLALLWAIMSVNFIIFSLIPGDPIGRWVKNQEAAISKEEIMELRRIYGLDMPLHERYFLYLQNMLTWNFGRSRYTQADIKTDIMNRLGNTLLLLGIADGFTIFAGTLLGVLVAYKRGSKLDTALVTASLGTYSLPVFWLGWLILFFFAIYLKWFPVGGIYPAEWMKQWPTSIVEIIAGRLKHIVLPVLTLFIFNVGGWLLLTRSCVLEAITEDYVVTARAKGLSTRKVLLNHVLRVASLPIVTSLALTLAGLWSGAIVTETVFSYEGMGRWIWRAIGLQDIPIMYVVFYISALTIIIANFMADLIYGVLDPRIRVGG
ncbi:MAG: ABC transporter permease [Candidatus Bathyarchaeia archaeon]